MVVIRSIIFGALESPKYLLMQGRRVDAVRVLNELSVIDGSNVVVVEEDLPLPLVSATSTKTEHLGWLRGLKVNVATLLSPSLRTTTLLIFAIWMLIAVGYTSFNSFLPKYLSSQPDSSIPPDPSSTYISYFIISLAALPGSALGAFGVDSVLGRRGTMSLSTLLTAVFLLVFALAPTTTLRVLASCGAAFTQNIMYGVLYAYTPEVFPAAARTTGTGAASALGRCAGSLTPVLAGWLLETFGGITPLYVASGTIAAAAVCMVLLPIETSGRETL
ncbi:hypothetical protein HK104_005716 [Borealophlyctis nickersoniae]|nr:hypothetical protein HK104_005716 [Borealophlyctis nickersoniae]